MLKRILVGIGGTAYTDVTLTRAIKLAKAHQAELTGISVINSKELRNIGIVGVGNEREAEAFRQQRVLGAYSQVQKSIDHFESLCEEHELKYKVELEKGDPFTLMIKHARHHDLIVFGLRSLFEFGDLVEPEAELMKLISKGVRPILAAAPVYRSIKRVVIAYSGSMESAETMRQFVQMSLWPLERVHIVYFGEDDATTKELLFDASEYVSMHGLKAQTEIIPGAPKKQLLEYANMINADMVVMGNSVKSVFFKDVVGETVLYTVQHSDIPLFLSQ